MRNLRGLRLTLALLLLIFPANTVLAEETPCSGSPANPADVSLQLSLKDGQTTFREGEIIALQLSFSSAAKGKYELSTQSYDRSGRLSIESFCLTPSGRDPLADYFSFGGFFGGGLSSIHHLDDKPFTMTRELNEWQSLSPGTYRLYVESGRLGNAGSSPFVPGTARSVPLRSNTVDFQVVAADSQWQSEQLTAALKGLDSTSDDEVRHAARVLRFLGTEQAAREMARRFWGANEQPHSWEFMFGLIGSPHRAVAIQELKAAISAPQHPITVNFLRTLALLEIYSNAKYDMPAYDPAKKDEWQKKATTRNNALEALMKLHQEELASVIATKTGEARAISLKTILVDNPTPGAGDKHQLRQQLVASWDALPAAMRNELIDYHWESVGGPEFLPVLRRIVSSPPATEYSGDRIERGIALRRIYELSPAEGRDFILKEIDRERTDMTIAVLGLLPEKELPEVESPVLARVVSGNHLDIDYQLLDRYATRRVLPEVKSIYEKSAGQWACAPQSALLRYFLRIDPDYGVAKVAEALNLRKTTGCYQMMFSELREFVSLPQVEKIAMSALNDPSARVVASAAEGLATYGSAKAETALRKRLEQLHREWKAPVEKPEGTFPAAGVLNEQAMMESALVRALVQGQAWFYGTDKLQELKEFISSSNEQKEIDGMIGFLQKGVPIQLSLSWFPNLDQVQYTVGYMNGNGMKHLQQKLSQLPAGTHLSCITTRAQSQYHHADFEAVEEAAGMAGLVLEIQTPR